VILSTWEAETEEFQVQGQPELHSETLSPVIENLPIKLKALSSNSRTEKKLSFFTSVLGQGQAPPFLPAGSVPNH
jgi:hypothetical protein